MLTNSRLSRLAWMLLLVFLTACGGGGGAPGKSSGATDPVVLVTPLFTTAPSTALSLTNGTSSPDYTISGGVSPYAVSSDNPTLLTPSVSGSTLRVAAATGRSGSGTVYVVDAAGTRVSITVTVPVPTALFASAPSSFSLSVGATNFISVAGGVPFGGATPYFVNNSNPSVLRAVMSGSMLTVQGLSTGTATVAVSDSAGTVLTLLVTVPAPSALYSDAPSNLTIARATANVYSVFGGVPFSAVAPYQLNNTNPTVASAVFSGSALTVTGLSTGSTTLNIRDAVGSTTNIQVTVPAPDALVSTAPTALTLAMGTSSPAYAVSGGLAPYSVSSSNTGLVTAGVVGSSLTINAVANTNGGTANVIVMDARNTPLTIAVTVPAPVALFTTAPASLAMPKPDSSNPKLSFAIIGGLPNYSVVSLNPDVVSVDPRLPTDSTYTLTSRLGGVANILITDSRGATVTVTATVPAAPALFSDAPSNVTVSAGGSYDVTISGGVAPYTALSGNTAVATVSPVAGKFRIAGVVAGATAITFKDASGTSLTVSVTVPAPDALYTDTSPTLSLAMGTTHIAKIYGGTGLYAVNNSNPAVITTGLSGSSLTILAKTPGVATVAISDAAGKLVTLSVTVPAANTLFSDAPASLTIARNTSSTPYTVYGGQAFSLAAPYVVSSSNPAVATAALSGSTLTVSGVSSGAATVTVRDAANASVTVQVTVPAPDALVSTAPTALTLAMGTSSPAYAVSGGLAPYSVSSSNTGLVTAGVVGSSLTINAVANTNGGTANVIVMDARNTPLTIAVTVPAPVALFTTAPASLAIASGGTARSFAIFGGRAPYTVVNANPAVASGAVSGSTLDILGATPGSTNIFVSDALGATVTIGVTVTSPGPLFTSAQSSLTIAKDLSDSFTINGGMPAYSVTSNNNSVARVSMVGATGFKIEALSAGSATVVVTDALNTTVSIAVNVPAPGVLYTTAPSSLNITRSSSPYSFAIKGGYPSYVASSSDAGVVAASVSVDASGNATLNITGVNGGAATVTVRDSQAQVLTVQVTVASSTALFSNAPATVQMATTGANSVFTYLVSGGAIVENGTAGVGSYYVRSSNPAVVDAAFVGPVLTVTAKTSGSGTIRVTDAAGKFLDIPFTVVSSSGASSSPSYPSLTAALETTGGLATSSIDATGYTLLKVTMKDPSGVAIPNQVISVTADATKLSFPEGTAALTDINGLATIKVSRASLLATGAGAITINYDYKPGMIASYSGGGATPTTANLVNSYVGYQVTTALVSLDPISLGSGSLAAYGTQQVSVLVRINGAAATSTPVTVSFSATCGQISPATASTDSTGTVLVTYSATDATGTSPSTLGCSGKTVQITASSSGAAAVTSSLTVSAAPATSMGFVSASPTRIYLANSGGVSQSLLTFQLLNQLGEGIQGQAIQLTMRSLTGGTPKAAFDTSGSVAPVTLTTDANGKVTQPVYAGSVPSNVVVNAALVSTPTIQADSAVLAIASGRPVQSRLSMAIEKFAIEGYSVDGTTTNVTLNLSDRQGNPVPDGTAVNFVTEGGVMIPPTCVTGAVAGDSRCSVSIRSQGTRPSNGLVTIMAYAAGEEDFVDANGNNTYDCGEAFTDLGLAYRDDTMTSTVVNAYVAGEFSVPRAAASSSCPAAVTTPSVSAGDGVWGAADVRKQQVIVFATSGAVITGLSTTSSSLSYRVADGNGNSMPTGTTVAVTIADNTPTNSLTCAVAAGGSVSVPNSLLPMTASAFFTGCASNDVYIVTVTSPLGTVSSNSFVVP